MSERSESKRLGAKQHKNSGRNTHKGDATWKNFTVDFKEVGKSFTLNQKVWAKAVTDAIKNNNDPAIIVAPAIVPSGELVPFPAASIFKIPLVIVVAPV